MNIDGKIILIGIFVIAGISLIIMMSRTLEFATTSQKNEFKCSCELPEGGKVDLVLRINTSDKYTPEPLRETIFNVVINNTSVPCKCRK
ncbi:TPA: hypothetical protein H1016_01155 [archaeon]|uniref:Uncharacterized protein n=1 Tax=Candidatus Naiadarchaeum limnaeum TaxID=2756139 RepID=A0A832UUW2_9ARCH|nr:hypothetical protein [Candidatus Naiadarchaeum limnaeum]